jgi:hypothetical protein
MTESTTRGAVLSHTRLGVWVLFVLAAANGLFLYFAADLSDTDYAWSIKPAISGAFIGAGFMAGTLATGLVLWKATRWRSFALLPAALWVLASSLLAATIIHHDRFKWDYPPTWVWALVYGFVPLAIPVLMLRQRRTAEALPPADPRLLALRVVSAIVGAGLLIGAIALFAEPVSVGRHWLWPLTPLLARAVACWYALFGVLLVTHALGQRRASEGLIGYATLACWAALLLILPVVYRDTSGGAWWYALMVALLALGAYGVRVAWPERDSL